MRRNISCCADRVTVKRTFHTNMDIVTDKKENISCESVTYEGLSESSQKSAIKSHCFY